MRNLAKRKTILLQDITFLSFSREYSFLILFALFFSRVQGCVDCNAVRRARGKLVFFSEKKSGRRHLEFFHEKAHHRTPRKKLPPRKKAMRGSTGCLDMNKNRVTLSSLDLSSSALAIRVVRSRSKKKALSDHRPDKIPFFPNFPSAEKKLSWSKTIFPQHTPRLDSNSR